ncbi:hypothetical protein [Aneurinibacillus terranovensis]|uniref:hypothetical protein n=1 Tax=Aneurinibacillus terranovensis TaxID=278991 RepID=UPI0012DE796A|nr:hypothetical protein [Aneurinibacillus terranovensis]
MIHLVAGALSKKRALEAPRYGDLPRQPQVHYIARSLFSSSDGAAPTAWESMKEL